MSRLLLDLTRCHFVVQRRDLSFAGTWYFNGRSWRPCLAIYRTGDVGSEDLVPCIVPLDGAWIFEETRGDGRRRARMTQHFLKTLRLEQTLTDNIWLSSAIHDLMGDLASIPPYQSPEAEVIAEVTITNRQTGTRRDVVLRDV